MLKYQRMKFSKILKELDSEEKARAWVWLAKLDGKEFICPKCLGENYYQQKIKPEIRKCKTCGLRVRARANTIFQNSKTYLPQQKKFFTDLQNSYNLLLFNSPRIEKE